MKKSKILIILGIIVAIVIIVVAVVIKMQNEKISYDKKYTTSIVEVQV